MKKAKAVRGKSRGNPAPSRKTVIGIIGLLALAVSWGLPLQAKEQAASEETKTQAEAAEEGRGVEESGEKPKVELIGEYIYDPTGKTDPFKPFIEEEEAVEEKKKRKPKTYLETVDISQLDLTAIVLAPDGNWAMVRDNKGMGHVITKGTAIGTNGGVVHKIKDDAVIIREEQTDFRGKTRVKDITKELEP